jgi:thiamine biosynthesis lipoprotein
MSAATALAQRRTEQCMGTVFSFDIKAPGIAADALNRVIAWLHSMDALFSTYKDDSQINRLSRGELRLRDCAPEVHEVLERCEQLEAETGGYFCARYDGRLDPSGFVKGWAIERASDQLRAAGSVNHCVNGGGDVQCAGEAAPANPWRVGITHPLQEGNLAGIVSGRELAVATSGSAERGPHILDPHDGSTPSEFASVTVIGTRLSVVDSYATAAFAMGAHAYDWVNREGLRALMIRPDGSRWTSDHLEINPANQADERGNLAPRDSR